MLDTFSIWNSVIWILVNKFFRKNLKGFLIFIFLICFPRFLFGQTNKSETWIHFNLNSVITGFIYFFYVTKFSGSKGLETKRSHPPSPGCNFQLGYHSQMVNWRMLQKGLDFQSVPNEIAKGKRWSCSEIHHDVFCLLHGTTWEVSEMPVCFWDVFVCWCFYVWKYIPRRLRYLFLISEIYSLYSTYHWEGLGRVY